MRTIFFGLAWMCAALATLAVPCCLAAETSLDYTLDLNGPTINLPDLFRPAIDLSGRGFHYDPTWPQSLAAESSLALWGKEFGYRNVYRLQYNLWEISQLVGNKQLQDKLLANYEAVIKKVSDAGGTVILDIFSTPLGQGKVLDKKSAPVDPVVFESIVRDVVRYFSCTKKYNVWYEVWSAPDLDTFFLGRQQEYLQIYRAAASAVKQLESEYAMHIPLGGPSTSAWFRAIDNNESAAPEDSLIYQLIRFCYHQRLPLDFISWHAYTTDPKVEKESTAYQQHAAALVREWLGYFNLSNVQLVVDEWNYDDGLNVSPQRADRAYVAASYIPARLRHMYEAGVDKQVFFALEDFHDNKEGVNRNIGAFWFTQNAFESEAGPKVALLNVFRMLSVLGANMFVPSVKFSDECVGVIATKSRDQVIILVYNYIDPDTAKNFVSRSIGGLSEAERRQVVEVFRRGEWFDVLEQRIDPGKRALSKRVKNLLRRSAELHQSTAQFMKTDRKFRLLIKNLKEDYTLQRYRVDSSCVDSCIFAPEEEGVLAAGSGSPLELQLAPYSVHMLVLSKKPAAVAAPSEVVQDAKQNEK